MSLARQFVVLPVAACSYCLLSTIESVCGEGCVRNRLHIITDYPIVAYPCAQPLAAALRRAQFIAAYAAIDAGLPVGLSAPLRCAPLALPTAAV